MPKIWFHGKNVVCTIKFSPVGYLVNHVEINNECQLPKTNQTKNTTDDDRTIVVIPILKLWMNGNSKLSIWRKKRRFIFANCTFPSLFGNQRIFQLKIAWFDRQFAKKKIPTIIARTTNIANLELHFEAKIGQFSSNNEKIIIFVVSKPF